MINNRNKNTPVTELQNMLRNIASVQKNIPIVNPDGIYGRETSNAVRVFQRQVGLAPTGDTDFPTWNAIKSASEAAAFESSEVAAIKPFHRSDYVAKRGEKSPIVFIIQIILDGISPVYDGIDNVKINGVYDEDTERHVRTFQGYHRLEPTGNVDKSTWNAMAKSYNTYAHNPNYVT